MDAAGSFEFARLRRYPDIEAENLFAYDATDELLLQEAAGLLAGHDGGTLAIVGDRYGALALGAAALYGLEGIRVHQDGRSAELALAANAETMDLSGTFTSLPLGPELFAGAKTILWQLPRSLDEVAEVAGLIARSAAPYARVLAGGRIKHMTLAMNAVLGQYFEEVSASRAWRKSRLLSAAVPRTELPRTELPASDFPRKEFNAETGLWLCAHGATFAGTKLDIGTRYLLGFEPEMARGARTAVDLGCGSGVVASYLAKARGELAITATDQSAAAVASARATAEANGFLPRITAIQDDAMAGLAPGSVDLVVLNPPFHVGATVHAGIALKLFDAAARVLAPGGELWTVYNTHLDYQAQLERRVGPTWVKGRNGKFTVAVSVKSALAAADR